MSIARQFKNDPERTETHKQIEAAFEKVFEEEERRKQAEAKKPGRPKAKDPMVVLTFRLPKSIADNLHPEWRSRLASLFAREKAASAFWKNSAREER